MKKFVLEFSPDDMQVLQAGLIELPWRLANPLIQKIERQIIEAQKQQEPRADQKSMQRQFDVAVDKRDLPSGSNPPDMSHQ